jgi:hypothetical protein
LSAASATELETTMAQHATRETMSRFFRMNYLLREKTPSANSGTDRFLDNGPIISFERSLEEPGCSLG